MKILFVTNIPSPYRIEFFNELGKTENLKVIFEAEKAPLLNSNWYKSNNIKNFDSIFLKKGEIEEKQINWKVFKYIKKNQQDVIVVTNYAYLTEMMVIIWLKIRNIPYYLEVDGGIIKDESIIKKRLKSFLISAASGYISPSKKTDQYLLYYGAKVNNIHRYSFTSLKDKDILKQPTSFKMKKNMREKLGIKEEKVVLSIGQFIPRKGFDILLNACINLKEDIGIYIIGGEPTLEFKNLKQKYNLNNVHFIDFKSKDELKSYYMASDVFVLPTREDIWGLVVNEALAYGLPVITTENCNAGLELVKNDVNGYIIPIENSKILQEKIEFILNDTDLLSSMSINSLKSIREYTIENMATQHINIFRNNIK